MEVFVIKDKEGRFVTLSMNKEGAIITAENLGGSVVCYHCTKNSAQSYATIYM